MKTVHSKLLAPYSNLQHFFTTRLGGVSTAPFDTNNLAFHVGDTPEDVIKNHQKLANDAGYHYHDLIHMQQIHSDKVVIVDPKKDHFKTPPLCDALITNQTNIPLMVMTADCTPILIYEHVNQVIAVVHAGRAGAFQSIVTQTIQTMQHSFNSQLENIHVILGPSIGACCYEVGEEIAIESQKLGFGFAITQKKAHYFLDVNAIILKELLNLGIKKEHIEDLKICNACQNNTYFSYRADQQQTGRMAGVLMLKA